MNRRRVKVPKNTIKNTSKVPEEVDLTVKPILPTPTLFIIIKQPKDL